MHVLAYVPYTGVQIGTAQVLTFAILISGFCVLVFMILFWMRTGHERAHRLHYLRHSAARDPGHERLQELEDHEPPPQTGENLPR